MASFLEERLARNPALLLSLAVWSIPSGTQAAPQHRLRCGSPRDIRQILDAQPAFAASDPARLGTGGRGESMPRPFRRTLSLRGRVYERLRDVARTVGEHDPLVQLTARRAALAFATTEASRARLLALGCRQVRIFPESGLAESELDGLGRIPALDHS